MTRCRCGHSAEHHALRGTRPHCSFCTEQACPCEEYRPHAGWMKRAAILVSALLLACGGAPVDAPDVIDPPDAATDAKQPVHHDGATDAVALDVAQVQDVTTQQEATIPEASDGCYIPTWESSQFQMFCGLNGSATDPKWAGCTVAIICPVASYGGLTKGPGGDCHWGGDDIHGRTWCCP